MPPGEPVADRPERGLDHGAYVPLIPMFPEADIPVLQMSMPDLQPAHLFEIGRRLAPLRDEGVLIMGSGFMTHGLPFIHEYWDGRAGAPEWSIEFDLWAAETLERGDLDALFDFGIELRGCRTPTDGRAFRAALRRPGRCHGTGSGARVHDRRLLAGPGQALLPGSLTAFGATALDRPQRPR